MPEKDRLKLDADYSPSRLVDSIDDYLRQYRVDSERVAERYSGTGQLQADCVYGHEPRQRIDLITPQASTGGVCPLVVFIHGGFWKALSKNESLYAAETWVESGVAFAALGYSLAPDASLTQIVDQCYAGVDWLVEHAPSRGIDPHRIVLVGHSAGAHLAAMCVARQTQSVRPAGAVLIGGVFELEPISRCYVNDTLGLRKDEIDRLSPVRRRPNAEVPVSIVYGDGETQAFKQQSEDLAQAWQADGKILRCEESSPYNHFDLVQQLGNEQHVIAADVRTFLESRSPS